MDDENASCKACQKGIKLEAAEAITALKAELEKVKAEKERFKEYAIDADNTMDSLYGAGVKFVDDTILAFWDEWRGQKEE